MVDTYLSTFFALIRVTVSRKKNLYQRTDDGRARRGNSSADTQREHLKCRIGPARHLAGVLSMHIFTFSLGTMLKFNIQNINDNFYLGCGMI